MSSEEYPSAPRTLPRRAFSIPETAHQLGTSERTVYNMIRDGQLDTVLVGRRRKITADSLNRLVGRGGKGGDA